MRAQQGFIDNVVASMLLLLGGVFPFAAEVMLPQARANSATWAAAAASGNDAEFRAEERPHIGATPLECAAEHVARRPTACAAAPPPAEAPSPAPAAVAVL